MLLFYHLIYLFSFFKKKEYYLIDSINLNFTSYISYSSKFRTVVEEKEILKKFYALFLNPKFRKNFLINYNKILIFNEKRKKFKNKIFDEYRWQVQCKDEKYFKNIFLKDNKYFIFPSAIENNLEINKFNLIYLKKILKFTEINFKSNRLYIFEKGIDGRVIIFFYENIFYLYVFEDDVIKFDVFRYDEFTTKNIYLINYIDF